MKLEQQRIAIAEACGWQLCTPLDLNLAERIVYGDTWWRNPDEKTISGLANLPNYPSDLNAMHEAENVRIKDWHNYIKMLTNIIAGLPIDTRATGLIVRVDTSLLITATASQRAEAFLRTLNLWTDE